MVTAGDALLEASELEAVLKDFVDKFGLSEVDEIIAYLCKLLDIQMSGYDFSTLPEEDFVHVGGPLLLNLN